MRLTEQPDKGHGMDKNIFARRRDRLRKLMRGKGMDAMLVSLPANRFYLSGFELHDPQPNESVGRIVITADGRDWLATDSRYATAAEGLWDKGNIFIYGGDALSDLRGLLARCGSVVGLEAKNVSWDSACKLARAGGRAFCPALVRADGLVESLRVIKDENEIRALKASFKLNHQMFAWLEERISNGMVDGLSEKDLSWQIECYFRENGARELAFDTIVATGANAALPHAEPGEAPVKSDSALLVDAGCRVDCYCSDQTRVFWSGNQPANEYLEALRLVREAQQRALDMMRAGVSCSEVYHAARKVFEKAGVEKHFTHGLGHGVGLETHEAPSLSPRSNTVLEAGMVVTVEPGLYYPGRGGARWEYTVLVEENGVKIL